MKPANKTKSTIPVPEKVNDQITIAINGKKEKDNGERYELTGSHKYYGQKELQPGTILTECNDGFFKIETPEGTVEHYRAKVQHISSQILKRL